MQSKRGASRQQRALERRCNTLLVQAMSGLVHGAEERWAEPCRVEARRDSHVVARKGGFEGVNGAILASPREVVSKALDHHAPERFLLGFVERLMQHRLVGPVKTLRDSSN